MRWPHPVDRVVDALYNIEDQKNADIVKHTSGEYTLIKPGKIYYIAVWPEIEFCMVSDTSELNEVTIQKAEAQEVSFIKVRWSSIDKYNRRSGRYLGSEITYFREDKPPYWNIEHRGLPDLPEIEVIEAQR
jgi:hypothetical protein